jgi:hypothetical protein
MLSTSLKRIIRRLMVVSLSFALAFVGGSPAVMAGGVPPAASIATDQAIAQAVIAYPAPPADFHPLSASDAELADYGFPPRPDARTAPTAYAHWTKLVSVPRVANPQLQQTKIYNGPIRHLLTGQSLRNQTVGATATNWSGYAVLVPSGTFTINNSLVISEWVVPRAQQAFGVCNGGWDYSSQWEGFDGVTSNDVLQAGTEVDACCGNCSGATHANAYYSWIEWYPGPEIAVSVPAARPGDLMLSEVWFTISPPFGHAALADYTLQQGQVYAFNPPAGTAFAGDSAEWVVERPFVQGVGLADLTNYAADQFNSDYAYNFVNYFVPGESPAGTTTYAISMVCPPWTPSASCPSTTVISTPYLYAPWAFWFFDSPPALY